MRKEIIFAILVGSSLGVAVAFGVWRINIFFKTSTTQNTTEQDININNNIKTNNNLNLDIISPSNYSVIGNSEVIISGQTNNNSLIALATGDDSIIITSDSKGKFETKVKLEGGISELFVTAFDKNGKSLNKKLTLIYSTLFENGDNAKALLGTVTDLSETTIQIRSDTGEIEQVSVNDDTTYANILKTTKNIEFSDIAIGDFIAALGTTNGNKILESSRILVTTAMDESTLRSIWGEVTTFNNKEFIIRDIAGNEWSIDAKGGIDTTALVDNEIQEVKLEIEEGDKIIVVGDFDKEELDAILIHIIS